MFLVGWWLGMRPGIFVWMVYALVDVAILAVSGPTLEIGGLAAISLVTKLVSTYLGALAGGRQA